MEQLNTVLPVSPEGNHNAGGAAQQENVLLDKVRQKFGFYGSISLIFGGAFSLFFYRSWLGINVLAFSALTILLLWLIMKKLDLPVKTGTYLCYGGVLLLGVSTCLTGSEILQLLNLMGILFLLELSLLHQFYDDRQWELIHYLDKVLGIVIDSIASLALPVIDGVGFLKRTRFLKNDRLRNVLLGIVASIPVLFIILLLLSEADMVFADMTGKILRVFFASDILYIAAMVVFGFFVCYCSLCGVLYHSGREKKRSITKADPTIAVTFMTMLCLVYALFCAIQLVFLFSNGVFTLPEQYTFAEYARKGFFELLTVTIINLIILLLCNALFRESRLLRFLVACMTACTFIMIASATYRMLLYIGAYHLTFLRLFVLLVLLMDALALTGIIIAQYKKDFPLFWYCVLVIFLCYIPFSFSKPDYQIASYLVNHQEVLNMEDMSYLTGELSLDAAPVVLPLFSEDNRWEREVISSYYSRITRSISNSGIRSYNFSYAEAAAAARKYPNNQ